jgi:hypothetical protein
MSFFLFCGFRSSISSDCVTKNIMVMFGTRNDYSIRKKE